MKPHEETWHYFEGEPPGLAVGPDRIADFDDHCGDEQANLARAKLAKAAPIMARALLKYAQCLECGSDLTEAWDARHGHKSTGCELGQALHDAGVIP
jgi:hypothetical protein